MPKASELDPFKGESKLLPLNTRFDAAAGKFIVERLTFGTTVQSIMVATISKS